MTSTVAGLEQRALDRSHFTCTACFCEENIFLLCKQLSQCGIANPDASDLFVVFISNSNKKVPIWRQKASSREDGCVVWDYHVICVQTFSTKGLEPVIWDLDTTLQFPVSFSKYVKEAFQPWLGLDPSFQRLYRVVAAPLFLKYFSSDRRHMRTLEGLWKMPPPSYDCITGEDGTVHNLEDYVTMSEESVLINKLSRKDIVGQRLGALVRETSLEGFFNSSISL